MEASHCFLLSLKDFIYGPSHKDQKTLYVQLMEDYLKYLLCPCGNRIASNKVSFYWLSSPSISDSMYTLQKSTILSKRRSLSLKFGASWEVSKIVGQPLCFFIFIQIIVDMLLSCNELLIHLESWTNAFKTFNSLSSTSFTRTTSILWQTFLWQTSQILKASFELPLGVTGVIFLLQI